MLFAGLRVRLPSSSPVFVHKLNNKLLQVKSVIATDSGTPVLTVGTVGSNLVNHTADTQSRISKGYINQLLIGWKRYPTVVTD